MEIMKTLTSFFVLLLHATLSVAQNTQPIRVVLLGVTHFANPGADHFNSKVDNFLSDQRQKEIQDVVKQLARFKPDKVVVETLLRNQAHEDSLYTQYVQDKYKLKVNEVEQLGYRLARTLNLRGVTCADTWTTFDMESVMKFAAKNGQTGIIEDIEKAGNQLVTEFDGVTKTNNVKNMLKYLNTTAALQSNAAFYTDKLVKVGKDTAYVGSDVVAEWYKRNILIYTNIIRDIKPEDKAVVVIFGQGHIPILTHLFETNPKFKVVPVKSVLQ